MKYKNLIMSLRRSCYVFIALILTMGILTGCVFIGGMPDDNGIPKSNVSVDLTSASFDSVQSEIDDSIPEEWRGHLYLESKDKGFCKKLDGKILVYMVFVSDSESGWDKDERKNAENEILAELQKIELGAEKFGASPSVFYVSSDVTVDIKANTDNYEEWQLAAMEARGYSSVYNAQRALASSDGYESAPIVFVLNKSGRAFASQQSASDMGAETLVVYSDDISAFRHELLHLFGAKDFYFPEEVQTAAEKYLENSIMSDSEDGEIDDLTAFLVGWTDELSKNAISFLAATKHLSEDYISDESDKNQFTGYGTRSYGDGIYTGNMIFGVPQGEGMYAWDNGDVYNGSWTDGVRNGKGKLTWANGDMYEGDFVDGERTGKGKLIFTNGDVYEGDFVNNERTGKGSYFWADGDSYTGDFTNGSRSGKGVYIWAEGDRYEGDFVDGERTGKGKYIWSNGDVYEGEFKDNKFDGYGVWTDTNGNVREGNWKNGEFVG